MSVIIELENIKKEKEFNLNEYDYFDLEYRDKIRDCFFRYCKVLRKISELEEASKNVV